MSPLPSLHPSLPSFPPPLPPSPTFSLPLLSLSSPLPPHHHRVMDQHNREVSEMEEILEQQLSEVEQDHRLKVWRGVGWGCVGGRRVNALDVRGRNS